MSIATVPEDLLKCPFVNNTVLILICFRQILKVDIIINVAALANLESHLKVKSDVLLMGMLCLAYFKISLGLFAEGYLAYNGRLSYTTYVKRWMASPGTQKTHQHIITDSMSSYISPRCGLGDVKHPLYPSMSSEVTRVLDIE